MTVSMLQSDLGTRSSDLARPEYVALRLHSVSFNRTAPGRQRPVSGQRKRRKAHVGARHISAVADHSGTDQDH